MVEHVYFSLLALFRYIYLIRYKQHLREQERLYKKMARRKTEYIGETPRPLTAMEMSRKHVYTKDMSFTTITGREIILIEPVIENIIQEASSRTGALRLFTRYDAFTTPEIIDYIRKITESSRLIEE